MSRPSHSSVRRCWPEAPEPTPRARSSLQPPGLEQPKGDLVADAKPNITPFVAAYDRYVRAMQHLDIPVELEERATKAFNSYSEAVASAPAVPREVADAFAEYAAAVRDIRASEGVGEVLDDSYRRFLRDERSAWNEVDVESLDAASVAS